MRKAMVAACIATVTLGGCFRSDKPVAVVGDYTITDSDVEYRAEVAKIYYPKEFEAKPWAYARQIGLNQLINSYQTAQILTNRGRGFTEGNLVDESTRIDRESRDRITLAKVKKIFGNDEKSYLKVFVLPNLADRLIYYGYFLSEPSIHSEARKLADDFASEALAGGASFDRLVSKHKAKAVRIYVSEAHGIESETARKERLSARSTDKTSAVSRARVIHGVGDRIQNEVKSAGANEKNTDAVWYLTRGRERLGKNGIFRAVLDRGEAYQVIRYVGRGQNKGEEVFDVVSFPKTDYAKWREQELKKIPVRRL